MKNEQAEPVGYFVNDESDDQWHQVDYEQRNGADTYPLYLHPPAPQQAEPVAQIGWADEFGNLFPMAAWKPAQRTHHDSHKTAWRPVFLHPPAAEVQQAEPVWVRPDQMQKARQAPFLCRVSPTKDSLDLVPLYLHPFADEVQKLRDALDEIESETQDVSIQQIARKALEGK